jgi:hypothetical protein
MIAMERDDFRKYWEAEWPPFITEAREAYRILAERLYDGRQLTGCTSYIQRKMSCSYRHADEIIRWLEEKGALTAMDAKGARQLMPFPAVLREG